MCEFTHNLENKKERLQNFLIVNTIKKRGNPFADSLLFSANIDYCATALLV